MRGVQFFLCFKVVSHFVCFLLFICLVSDNDWLVKKTEQLQLGLRMIVATELAYFGASLMCLLLSALRNHIQLILKTSYRLSRKRFQTWKYVIKQHCNVSLLIFLPKNEVSF